MNKITAVFIAIIVVGFVFFGLFVFYPTSLHKIGTYVFGTVIGALITIVVEINLNWFVKNVSDNRKLIKEIPVLKRKIEQLKIDLEKVSEQYNEIENGLISNTHKIENCEDKINILDKGVSLINPQKLNEQSINCINLLSLVERYVLVVPDTVYDQWSRAKLSLIELLERIKSDKDISDWLNNPDHTR